ncbi:transmembrane sensor/regulator PpyR [Pseudomonas sp. Q1-7]|uniref:transmembrane sensor/regulator PpyR n=1 Tax=Pseudomonas sp. Q1-7 TaxID=3020843 RepID=UPI002301EF7A|nr:transmembrane sensor/regulator PpyR [Pseudomonas sp. Q1-7]
MSAFFESPRRVQTLSTHLLAGGTLTAVLGTLLAYVLDAYLPIGVQVLAHFLTLLGPTAIKLGYVLRLHRQYHIDAGLRRLGDRG